MNITTLLPEHHGCTFEGEIDGRSASGHIRYYENTYYLLQNQRDGSGPGDGLRWGYRYSWSVSGGTPSDLASNAAIVDIMHYHDWGAIPTVLSYRLWEKLMVPLDIKVKDIECMGFLQLPGRPEGGLMLIPIQQDEKSPNSFDIRKGELSYFSGIQPLNEHDKWDRAGRQTMKPSKLILMLTEYLKFNRAIANPILAGNRFVELMTASLRSNVGDIKISEDVYDIYTLPTAPEGTGSLGGSCMRPEADYQGKDYLYSYNKISPKLKIAYLTNTLNQLVGRALLWEEVVTPTGDIIKVMDRIYGSEDTIYQFIEWAQDNEYFYKTRQTYHHADFKCGGLSYSHLMVKLPSDIRTFPYMDSFCHYSDLQILTTTGPGISLQATDGTDLDGLHVCRSCGSRCDPQNDDSVVIGCDELFCCISCAANAGFSICLYCDGWFHEDDGVGGYCCEACANRNGYFSCSECGAGFHGDGGFAEYCSEYCAERSGNYARCEGCTGLCHHDELEDGVCADCVYERERACASEEITSTP